MVIERLIREALLYLNYAGLDITEVENDKTGLLDDAYDHIVEAMSSLNAWLESRQDG